MLEAHSFSKWQPVYADHGISTFPVKISEGVKRPAVRNYLRAGRRYSADLAKRFPDAPAFGFALGARTEITVLDVDTNDERVLADALTRHGHTPIVVQSGSGNYQAWYRHNGERRHIRPVPALPIDVLGAGYVVAPPSEGAVSPYRLIHGSLDDLSALPVLHNFNSSAVATDAVVIGRRNQSLWEHCMRHAKQCDDFTALLDVAETHNQLCLVPPLAAEEVIKAAKSAWDITERGENRFGQIGAFVTAEDADLLVSDPHLLALVTWLKAKNGPDREFLVADGLHQILRWSLVQLRRCRRLAIEGGWIAVVRPPTRGCAALYRWGDRARNGLSISEGHDKGDVKKAPSPRGGVVEDSLSISLGHCSDEVSL